MSAIRSDADAEQKSLQLVNHVYEMMHDPSVFITFAEKLSEVIDDEQSIMGVRLALENSAKLAGRFDTTSYVELSRDIGVIVVGIDNNNKISHVPPFGEKWLGSKFVGNENGIGWIDAKDHTRNVAHTLQLDVQKHLPVHFELREGVKSGQITKLAVIHQFALSDGAQDALRELYDLTPAEIRLCVLIAEGNSLKEAANIAKVKVSTPRSHLKKIFLKMGMKSQTDLIRILTQISAASAIQDFSRENKINLIPDWKNGIVSIQTKICKTRYGTRLTYSEFGDPEGKPVLYFHQAVGSRIHTRSMAEAAKKHRLLIYKFDRPGFGDSPILPNMSIKAIGHVTEDLLNHISADEVYAIGHAVGARTLLDIIPHTNERIKGVAVYSFRGVFKYSSSTLMNKMSQIIWENPHLLVSFLKIMKLNSSDVAIENNLKKYYQDSSADLKVLENSEFMRGRIRELAIRKDFSGTLFDHKNLRSPFPDFSQPAFDIPIKAIFGTDDPFNKPQDAEPYLRNLSQCQTLLSKGDGQLHMEYDFDRFLHSAYSAVENCPWITEQS